MDNSTKRIPKYYENGLKIILALGAISFPILKNLRRKGNDKIKEKELESKYYVRQFLTREEEELLKSTSLGKEIRKKVFLLDDKVVFCNHGSFGTIPRPIFSLMTDLYRKVEESPDMFLRYQAFSLWKENLKAVAPLLNVPPEDIVFVSNATTGVHCVIESLLSTYSSKDAVMSTVLTYNAVNNILFYSCGRYGIKLKKLKFIVPIDSSENLVDYVEKIIKDSNDSLKLAVFDHITSSTAVKFPLKKLTEVCHKYGIEVLVDGAHGIGNEKNIDLLDIKCDYYVTNLHKWLYAPRGCAVLYVAKEHQEKINPLLISHEWKNSFQMKFWMQGTRDYVPYFCTQACVQFYNAIGKRRIESYCKILLNEALDYLEDHWSTKNSGFAPREMLANMGIVKTPLNDSLNFEYPKGSEICSYLSEKALKEFNTVAVFVSLKGSIYTRISVNVYNTLEDYIFLADVIDKLANDPIIKERFCIDFTSCSDDGDQQQQ